MAIIGDRCVESGTSFMALIEGSLDISLAFNSVVEPVLLAEVELARLSALAGRLREAATDSLLGITMLDEGCAVITG